MYFIYCMIYVLVRQPQPLAKRPKSAENSVRFRDSQILKYLLYCAEIYHYYICILTSLIS
jgi:hypothetical protein